MATYKELLSKLENSIDSYSQLAIDLSDDLANNPELSGEEFESSAKMATILTRAGFEVEYPFCNLPTAFKGMKKNGEEGPKVAIMVEYDALPGLGHACGHCVHGSMSILAALGMGSIMDEIEGTLYVIGTPAEESDGAKCAMSESGVFDEMDLAIMIHSSSNNINTSGFRSLAMDGYRFTFTGKNAHAAGAPWEGKNALNGVQLMFHAIDMLRQHSRPEARIHGVIDSGGLAPNIVPDKAICRFEFRAPERSYLNELLAKCLNCARGAAIATETEVSWEKFESSFDDMLPNPSGEKMIDDIYQELEIELSAPQEAVGSTDVGNVTYRCPALQPTLSITKYDYPLHTIEFAERVTKKEAHVALIQGARVISRAVLKTMIDTDLRQAIWDDFNKSIKN